MKNSIKSFVIVFGLLITINVSATDSTENVKPNNNVPMNSCVAEEVVSQAQTTNAIVLSQIFLEELEEVDLGFDTYFYLPADFNPYKGMNINLNDIIIVEIEEEIALGFNTEEYLPKGFNPYTCAN